MYKLNVEDWIKTNVLPRIESQRKQLPNDLFCQWLQDKIEIEKTAMMRAIAGRNSTENIEKFMRVYQDMLAKHTANDSKEGDAT